MYWLDEELAQQMELVRHANLGFHPTSTTAFRWDLSNDLCADSILRHCVKRFKVDAASEWREFFTYYDYDYDAVSKISA